MNLVQSPSQGRISLFVMIGLTVGYVVLLPVWAMLFTFMAMGPAGIGGLWGEIVGGILVLWVASLLLGPVGAWICWHFRRQRWTWWFMTLPLQLIALLVAATGIMLVVG